MTFASGGMTDWQACVGMEKIWNSESRPGSMSRNVPSEFADAGARGGHRRDTADGRHVVATGTARVVVRWTQSLLRVLDLQEILEAEYELLKLDGR